MVTFDRAPRAPNQVCTGLPAGGNRIRTAGPVPAKWLCLPAGQFRTPTRKPEPVKVRSEAEMVPGAPSHSRFVLESGSLQRRVSCEPDSPKPEIARGSEPLGQGRDRRFESGSMSEPPCKLKTAEKAA